VSPELQQLIALQEIDLKIQEGNERLAAIPLERQRSEQQFNEFAARYNSLIRQLDETRLSRRKLELELEEIQQRQEKYKQDLMRVRNEKEYSTALREIDSCKKIISGLETQILQRMEEIESLEAEIAQLAPEIEAKRVEVDSQLQGFDLEAQQLERQQERLRNDRANLVEKIPARLINIYDRVARMRKGLALAEARDSACTACRMSIRPQVFSDVRKGDQLIQCDSCNRILYYRPVEAQQPMIEITAWD